MQSLLVVAFVSRLARARLCVRGLQEVSFAWVDSLLVEPTPKNATSTFLGLSFGLPVRVCVCVGASGSKLCVGLQLTC